MTTIACSHEDARRRRMHPLLALLRGMARHRLARKRRRATLDLVNGSPHLLRDIGLGDGHDGLRRP